MNLTKGWFAFASAHVLPDLPESYQAQQLDCFTPCSPASLEDLIYALGSVHVEFILMHPFREGNGRIARLLSDVMAVQADVGPLDYSGWDANPDNNFLQYAREFMAIWRQFKPCSGKRCLAPCNGFTGLRE